MRQSDDAVTPGPALCVNSLSVNEALPELSQTGLYKNIESKEVNEALWAFEPDTSYKFGCPLKNDVWPNVSPSTRAI